MNETALTFDCPSCGAALQSPGGASTMKCAYCGTSVVVPESLRLSPAANPVGAVPAAMDFNQLMTEALRMGQVVRLARGGLQSEAMQLYRENTGVDASQAEQVIAAMIAGKAQNPEMVRNEMAVMGEAIAAMRTSREMEAPVRRVRRSGGISCSGLLALVVIIAAALVLIHNSTGTAHDLLNRLIAQLNLSGLIH